MRYATLVVRSVSFYLCSLWIMLSKICSQCSIMDGSGGEMFVAIKRLARALKHRRADRLNKANMRASAPEHLL